MFQKFANNSFEILQFTNPKDLLASFASSYTKKQTMKTKQVQGRCETPNTTAASFNTPCSSAFTELNARQVGQLFVYLWEQEKHNTHLIIDLKNFCRCSYKKIVRFMASFMTNPSCLQKWVVCVGFGFAQFLKAGDS